MGMEGEWKEAVGLVKPDKGSLFGSGEKPELHQHTVKPDEWVSCFHVFL